MKDSGVEVAWVASDQPWGKEGARDQQECRIEIPWPLPVDRSWRKVLSIQSRKNVHKKGGRGDAELMCRSLFCEREHRVDSRGVSKLSGSGLCRPQKTPTTCALGEFHVPVREPSAIETSLAATCQTKSARDKCRGRNLNAEEGEKNVRHGGRCKMSLLYALCTMPAPSCVMPLEFTGICITQSIGL